MDNKTSYTKLVLLLFTILLLVVILFYMFDERESLDKVMAYLGKNEEIINFNYDSGLYDRTINLNLKLNNKLSKYSKIFYTLDGSSPSKESILYKTPIKLKLKKEKVTVYTFSAIIYYRGDYSKIFRKTYVITDNNIDVPIVNFIIDSEKLYNEKYGLLAERNLELRDKEDAKVARIMTLNDENFIDQDVGLLVSGGASRNLPVKSLKIIANYKTKNQYLNLNLNSIESYLSQPIKYKSIRLGSNGQDQEYSYLRNNVVQNLAYQSNFTGYKDLKRCIVYINGEYYGIMNLEQNYSDSFIKARFKLPENKIKKIKGSETKFFERFDLIEAVNNLNDYDSVQKLEKTIDMDNLLLYYAIELLSNNSDWPQKNYEVWKYEGKNNSYNKYTDGKFRFLLYDMDFTYFSEETSIWKKWTIGNDKFEEIINNSDSVFSKLMSNENYKNKFITIVNNLLNTSFKEENVINEFKEEYNKVSTLLNIYSVEKIENYENNFNDTIEIIKNRDDELKEDLRKYLNVKEDYNITFKTDSGSMLTIENINIYNDTEVTYNYSSNNVLIKANSYPGFNFSHFVINGEKIYENEINVSSDCIVEVISEKNGSDLIISEIKSNSSDYIILTNVSDKTISLNDYYLSDKKSNLLKYNLPNRKLKAKQSIKIYGKSNLDASFGDYITSFNMKYNEIVYVYNYKKKLIEDSIYIPKLNKKEIYFRDDNSNIFKIKLQK